MASYQLKFVNKFGNVNSTLNSIIIVITDNFRVAEMVCTISKHPQAKWGFWSSFEFCVSIITTVGEFS